MEVSPAISPSLRSERSCWRVLLSTTSFKVCLQGRSFCFLHTCLMLLLVMKWNETFKQGFEVLLRCLLNVSLERYFNCSLWNSLTGIVPYDWTLYIALYWSFVLMSHLQMVMNAHSFIHWHIRSLITDEKLVLINILMWLSEVLLTWAVSSPPVFASNENCSPCAHDR